MGIRFTCPNGHKLHVKTYLAGKRGVCPQCGAKILIPSEAEAEQLAAIGPVESGRVGPATSSVTLAGPFTDAASPSIVIAVADSSVATTPAAEAAPFMPPPIVAPPPPAIPSAPAAQTIALQPPAAAQPFLVVDAVEPVSPADRYVAQRERNRRNQVAFAVMLLLAVVVLAGVLVFVLQRGAGSAPAKSTQPVGLHEPGSSRHVTAASECYLNAHSALAAN
jgi:hypothetical protein